MKKLTAIAITLTAIGVAAKVVKITYENSNRSVDIKDFAKELSNQYQKKTFPL